MAQNELGIIESYFYDTLSDNETVCDLVGRLPNSDEGDNVWQIFCGVAHQKATYPHIIYRFRDANYRTGLGHRKTLTSAQYDILVVMNKNDASRIQKLADLIETVLSFDQVLDKENMLGCSPIKPLKPPPTIINGAVIIAMGATFDIRVRPS